MAAIRPLVLTMVFCSLTTTSAWAQDIASEDSIADEVELRDGTVVKARRVPKQAPSSDYTYTYKGVKYTYITENNYTRYFNLSVHKPSDYGWYPDNDGWYVNAEKAYITAASIDEESVPANGEVAILNDLVGFFTSHTHLGCIADHGFTGESKVKRIYFKDCDSWAYSANSKFYFFIGHLAFANAPQLEKVDLIRFLSNDQWGVMDLNNVTRIWDNFLEGSPNALIRVGSNYLQQFRNSSVWSAVKDRFISYEPSGYEMIEYGASYKCMKSDGKSYLDNSPGWLDYILRQLRPWNADYQNFNARQLLASDDTDATIYYTTIEGADPDYLKSHDGVLRIYNDVGSYYNYKTLAVRRGAFTGCDELKAVEFYQTNGRSENSYSDLTMVIENGAFRGCKNLKEIRMYYYIQDGDDHWETLGPEDVIPGDDIFGWKADFDEIIGNIDIENYEWEVPQVHIIVSPTRYMEFVNDPNWSRYRKYIVPADYEPSSWSAINEGGLTYDYASKTPNAASTSQVVTVEASWWNVPIIVAEIIITYFTAGTGKAGSSAAAAATSEATKLGTEITALNSQKMVLDGAIETVKQLTSMDGIAQLAVAAKQGTSLTNLLGGSTFKQAMGPNGLSVMYNILGNRGFSNEIVKEGIYDLFKNAVITAAQNRLREITSEIAAKELLQKTLLMQASQALLKSKLAIARTIGANSGVLATFAGAHMVSQIQPFSGQVNEDQMKNGMTDNMVANIHQVGMVGFGITTPDKKLIYHTYIKEADPNQTDFTIYNDIGSVYNYRTVGVSRDAFKGNTNVQRIKFAESRSSRFDSYASLLFTIPDSAFAGCTGLREFDLRYQTARGGETALGPENFILCGDSIFAGCDSTQLRIIVGEDRLQDFLDNPSWAKYSRYLTTGTLAEKQATSGYGVKYAYSYLENTTRHITYGMGHEIEHLYAYEADNSFLDSNSGALGLFNDVGNWNNYHLDYVKKGAFRDNQKLKEVSFWNINGFSIWGEAYADIDITLQDGSFKNCQNLESMGLVYLSHATTTRGSVKPLTPQTLRLGERVFDGTPKLRLKMMPTQVEAFLADSAWASYKDKFAPCLFKPVDSKVKSTLSDLRYTLHCSTMNNSWDIIDALQLKEKGFSWLNGKFAKSAIEEFPEFKIFEAAGLDYVGGSWFLSCSNLRNIELPSTVKHIGGWAFYGCSKLKEITIPAAVETIDACAFQYSGLKTVRCEGTKPAKLDYSVFDLISYSGFTIYVPAEAVDAYKKAWPSYAQYIKSDAERPVIHCVKTTKVGELAGKLGLETIMDGNFLTGLIGQYQQFDSLVVEGPLNGLDVGVLRFLGGADVNNSMPTLGRLRYLNLYGAELKKDTEHPYQCWGSNDYLEEDDMVGDFMFTYCDKLQTIILPKTAKKIGENVFEETHGLKHLAVGDETVEADNELFEDNKAPLEELVFLGNVCTSDDKTCWEPGAEAVYVKGDKVGQFLGRNDITSSCQLVVAAFKDSEAMDAFTRKGLFFPSEYRQLTSIDGILNDRVKSFDEFERFNQVTNLGSAFNGCKALERVTLPDSLRHMGYSAFQGCKKLRSITISADSVPMLEEGAFRDLPSDFRIYVPKTHTKRYRDAWPEYADHIAGNDVNTDDVIVVNVYKENQLGEALGLKVHTKKIYVKKDDNGKEIDHRGIQVIGIEGDYNHITKLKVNGLISGGDLALLRYLAGYCPWSDKPNLAGRLEYIDLYDTQLVTSEWHFAQDKLTTRSDYVWENDVLPAYAFLQCYQLKTLILPKGLKEIRSRSIMQCESLENVVVGDSIQILNWDAFDDDVSLTRMYLLAKNKPKMDADNWVWRNLCNNYNPTFDAFYVRPSLYNQYISDDDYVGNSWQRTNNISTGIFTDDATFASFAAHAAATEDDLSDVTSVNGWFKEHPGITDLTPLRYTLVETLRTEDMKPLTQLERIAMPMLLTQVGDGAFSNAKNLRYADFQLSDSLDLMNNLKDGGLQRIGLTERTLCYMPAKYGDTDEVNVAVGSGTSGFRAKNFRLYDDADYCVPIAFTADNVENTRTLAKSTAPYTVCLPYALDVPANAKVYRLSGRSNNQLIFAQHTDRMEALQPYLVWAEQGDVSLGTSGEVSIPVSGGTTYGRQQQSPGFVMRGTLDAISNQEAVDLGAYVMNDDAKWHPVLSDTEAHKAVTIPAFRCYLLQSRYNSRVAIGMNLEDANGMEQLRTIDSDGTERVYDLSGRRIDGNVRGIVIKNGRKIINN
jgi:hypothetical protein